MNKYLGITLAVLGLGLAIVPNFTDCASHGAFMNVMGKQIPMVCHWSARAEIAMGAPLVGIGAMMSFMKGKSNLLSLSVLGIVLGVLAVTLPTNIIGTCPGPTMTCNTLMKPVTTLLGSLAVAGSLGGLVLSRKVKS